MIYYKNRNLDKYFMKNAKKYETKIRKFLKGANKEVKSPVFSTPAEEIAFLVRAIVEENSPGPEVSRAMKRLETEFVDFNELRVAPPKDILRNLEGRISHAGEKAFSMVKALNTVFQRYNKLEIGELRELKKKDIKRYLSEFGLSTYAEALVSLMIFDVHAVPVDRDTVDILKMDEFIHPEADEKDTRAFLERIIRQEDVPGFHYFFRDFVKANNQRLKKKRGEEEKARQKAEEEQRKKEQEKARKREERKKAAEKKKKAKKKAKKKTKKKTKTKTKKKTKKKTRKKAPKKKTAPKNPGSKKRKKKSGRKRK